MWVLVSILIIHISLNLWNVRHKMAYSSYTISSIYIRERSFYLQIKYTNKTIIYKITKQVCSLFIFQNKFINQNSEKIIQHIYSLVIWREDIQEQMHLMRAIAYITKASRICAV